SGGLARQLIGFELPALRAWMLDDHGARRIGGALDGVDGFAAQQPLRAQHALADADPGQTLLGMLLAADFDLAVFGEIEEAAFSDGDGRELGIAHVARLVVVHGKNARRPAGTGAVLEPYRRHRMEPAPFRLEHRDLFGLHLGVDARHGGRLSGSPRYGCG